MPPNVEQSTPLALPDLRSRGCSTTASSKQPSPVCYPQGERDTVLLFLPGWPKSRNYLTTSGSPSSGSRCPESRLTKIVAFYHQTDLFLRESSWCHIRMPVRNRLHSIKPCRKEIRKTENPNKLCSKRRQRPKSSCKLFDVDERSHRNENNAWQGSRVLSLGTSSDTLILPHWKREWKRFNSSRCLAAKGSLPTWR